MIRVNLSRAADGAFVSCTAAGHAEWALRGEDIVCSAVTILLRTGALVLQESAGVACEVRAPEPGRMTLTVTGHTADTEERLQCVGDFLERGIASLEREFPNSIALQVVSV